MKRINLLFKQIKIVDILIYIFIIISFFDQTREALPLSYIVMKLYAVVRDFLILVLFVHFVIRKKKFFSISYLFGLILFLILLSIPISFLTGNNIMLSIKFAWLQVKHFLVYCILICYFSQKNIINILRFLINLGIIFFIFNIIFVVFFATFLTRLLSGGLRLTVGNSSTISFLYFTLFLISINFNLYKNEIINFTYSIIYFIAILTTVTTTAFVALIPILIIKYFDITLINKIRFIILFSIISLFLILSNSFESYKEKKFASYLCEKSTQVTELVFSKNKRKVGTLAAREEQKETIRNNMKAENYLIGLGSGGYQKYYSNLENFYYVLLYDYGPLALIFFVLLLIKFFIISFINGDYFFLQILILFAAYCYTLDFFLPYITGFSFVLLLAIRGVKREKNCCRNSQRNWKYRRSRTCLLLFK